MRAKAYIVHRAMCEPELEWSKPKDCLSAEPLYTSPPAQQEPDNSNDLTIAYMAGVQRGKELAQRTWVGLTDSQVTKAALWDLAVSKGLITVHSEQLAPGTWSAHLSVASWMEGHDKACEISNKAAHGIKENT